MEPENTALQDQILSIALIYPLRQTTSEISLARRVRLSVFKHEVSWSTPGCILIAF